DRAPSTKVPLESSNPQVGGIKPRRFVASLRAACCPSPMHAAGPVTSRRRLLACGCAAGAVDELGEQGAEQLVRCWLEVFGNLGVAHAYQLSKQVPQFGGMAVDVLGAHYVVPRFVVAAVGVSEPGPVHGPASVGGVAGVEVQPGELVGGVDDGGYDV